MTLVVVVSVILIFLKFAVLLFVSIFKPIIVISYLSKSKINQNQIIFVEINT